MRQLLCFLPLLLLLMPAAPVAAQDCTTDPCPAEPDCTGCDANTLIIDPENCRAFYICVSATEVSPLPFDCGEDEVFNATSHACEEGTECEECDGSSKICPAYECPAAEDGDRFPSPTDCNAYYVCDAEGGITASTCEDDTPFFDGKECQTDEAACCHCQPYCSADDVNVLIPDPVDCRRYYLCTGAGTPTISGTCPDGNFDTFTGGCSTTASCNPTCRNVVGSNGCIDPFTCLTEGFFAACPAKCTPEYYHCTSVTNEYQDAESCGTGVFHPDSHTCVDPEDCPYEE